MTDAPVLYEYVGPTDTRARAVGSTGGERITSAHDIARWCRETKQQPDGAGLIAMTYVIDRDDALRIADRRSEHVACARGGPVQSAGEMFVELNGDRADVIEISNYSTGFCPPPESWPEVSAALDRAGIAHPGAFTQPVIFRTCGACGQRNVIKDALFSCGICGADLPD